MGGAAFPTHVKLAPPRDKKIDTFILNGVECEPYLTADHRTMLEAGETVTISVLLAKALSTPLAPGTEYVLDVKPTEGAILSLHGFTPTLFP